MLRAGRWVGGASAGNWHDLSLLLKDNLGSVENELKGHREGEETYKEEHLEPEVWWPGPWR